MKYLPTIGLSIAMLVMGTGCGDTCEDACQNGVDLGCFSGDCGALCDLAEELDDGSVDADAVYDCQNDATTCEEYNACGSSSASDTTGGMTITTTDDTSTLTGSTTGAGGGGS
ncbi:MAG: hypothetical protein AAGA56_03700 [Myxococcota bacterium]